LEVPVLIRDAKRNRWVTLVRPTDYRTSTGKRISRRQVEQAMFAPGDGRVTRRSLLGADLSTSDGTGLVGLRLAYASFGCELHGRLQRNRMLEDNALTTLVSEAIK